MVQGEAHRKALSRIIYVEKNYSFPFYSYTSCGVTPVYSYSSKEVLMVPKAEIPYAVCFYQPHSPWRSCLRSQRQKKASLSYSLQEIFRQFGFNQGGQCGSQDTLVCRASRSWNRVLWVKAGTRSSWIHFVLLAQPVQRGSKVAMRHTILDAMHRGAERLCEQR